jgi:hypothetical protein
MSLSIPEKIGQLLALADSTNHPEEKKLAMERAMREASRHSIDLAMARAAVAKNQKREEPTHKRIVLGKRGQRALSYYIDLFAGLAEVNDLELTYFSNNTGVTVLGMPSDIEVCEAIYATAVSAMVSGGDEYLKKGEYKKEVAPRNVKIRKPNPDYGQYSWGYQEPKYIYEWTVVEKPVSGMTARQNFYAGFVAEVLRRLRAAKRETVQAAKQQAAELEQKANVEETSTALVLHNKQKEVRDYYEEHYRGVRMGTYSGGSKSPVYSSGARSAGQAHGRATNLGSSSAGAIGGARRQISG